MKLVEALDCLQLAAMSKDADSLQQIARARCQLVRTVRDLLGVALIHTAPNTYLDQFDKQHKSYIED